jgi:hypothetical protein
MAAVRLRVSRRASRILLACAVVLGHIGLFLLVSLSRPPEFHPRDEPPEELIAALPPEPAPPRRVRAKADRRRRKQDEIAAAPAPAAAPSAPSPGPNWTSPSTGGRGPAGTTLGDPFAVREALRASVGCDDESIKLRPDEQARCADRIAKWARKGKKIGPAADDPKRAAQLAADEDYARRMLDWKTSNCGVGVGGDARSTLGQMPPRRGQPRSDDDEDRRNAC